MTPFVPVPSRAPVRARPRQLGEAGAAAVGEWTVWTVVGWTILGFAVYGLVTYARKK